jgi:L-lactate dehydrogenase complex protein LldF
MVARIFEENGLGEYTESPEELTAQARRHFRDLFRSASMGITGANFVVAETGRLVTVSNEGNLRFSANAPRTHVAITGIEKIVATEAELAIILKLLARSATGQSITVYTQFFAGARKNGELDGPDESHLVFLNNGRTNLLGGEYREMLRCIRCGACLNVCPVYRAVSGHGYGSVYPGPMGAIFSPLLGGEESRKEYAWLPKASSLCGACEEVCPVSIPIPKMLIGLRHDLKDGAPPPKGTPGFGAWAKLANSPMLWRTSMKGGSTIGWGPAKLFPAGPFKAWLVNHDLPPWPKRDFRSWWKKRGSAKPKTNKLGGNHG